MTTWLTLVALLLGALLLGAGVLHLIPKLGSAGKRLSDAFARAPLLDLIIAYFIAGPMLAGLIAGARTEIGGNTWLGALLGFLAAVVAQVIAVNVWTILHELAHPRARKGPRIVTTLNRRVGPVRNFTAVWITALAVPLFVLIRLAEYIVYPPLTLLVRLPRYKAADWVNCSRHKFDGLIGHDLIWCLYCDWMTGVWSLGSEMLRNVESFWCPIRFHSEKKCANCAVDFPDVVNGWVKPDGTMAEVAAVLEDKYGKPATDGSHPWFGHPVRVTVEGAPVSGVTPAKTRRESDGV